MLGQPAPARQSAQGHDWQPKRQPIELEPPAPDHEPFPAEQHRQVRNESRWRGSRRNEFGETCRTSGASSAFSVAIKVAGAVSVAEGRGLGRSSKDVSVNGSPVVYAVVAVGDWSPAVIPSVVAAFNEVHLRPMHAEAA